MIEVLVITLSKLAYPVRLGELSRRFGRPPSALSDIITSVILQTSSVADRLLRKIDTERLEPLLPSFAAAIRDAGAPIDACWGFIDGTAREIARPTRDERLFYSGHKRMHCLKFQSIVTPDGIIAQLYGPVEGRRHDLFLVRDSDIVSTLSLPPFDDYVLYGDPGYISDSIMVAPFKGKLTPEQQEFNARMSGVRVAVEWMFGRITSLFQVLGFPPRAKLPGRCILSLCWNFFQLSHNHGQRAISGCSASPLEPSFYFAGCSPISAPFWMDATW